MKALGLKDAKDLIDGMITRLEESRTIDNCRTATELRYNKIQAIKAIRDTSKTLEIEELRAKLRELQYNEIVKEAIEIHERLKELQVPPIR